MESQLREQNATDKMDEVLKEIPRVRKDLGYIPLVTPTSQIVGTQAVINVMMGERYKNITKETAGVLKGEYGSTPAEVNKELQARVLDGGDAITCRPADLLKPEMEHLIAELKDKAIAENIKLADAQIDDVLTYALFPQVGLKFLKNRNNPDAFEPAPGQEPKPVAAVPKAASTSEPCVYSVRVGGQSFTVEVAEGGSISNITPTSAAAPAAPVGEGESIGAPLAGNIFKVNVASGDVVNSGDVIIILEAMKMETEIRASRSGTVQSVDVKEGDAVAVGDTLLTLA